MRGLKMRLHAAADGRTSEPVRTWVMALQKLLFMLFVSAAYVSNTDASIVMYQSDFHAIFTSCTIWLSLATRGNTSVTGGVLAGSGSLSDRTPCADVIRRPLNFC